MENVQCPACQNAMKEVSIDTQTLHVCDGGCGGVWFDAYQYRQFDNGSEHDITPLEQIAIDPALHIDAEEKRHCPRCLDIIMLKHFASFKRESKIDECGMCGGVFLDNGELETIRDQFGTEEDRNKATHQFISGMFDGAMDAMKTMR
jgi:Zn-finger nucleic acid-binding protein